MLKLDWRIHWERYLVGTRQLSSFVPFVDCLGRLVGCREKKGSYKYVPFWLENFFVPWTLIDSASSKGYIVGTQNYLYLNVRIFMNLRLPIKTILNDITFKYSVENIRSLLQKINIFTLCNSYSSPCMLCFCFFLFFFSISTSRYVSAIRKNVK